MLSLRKNDVQLVAVSVSKVDSSGLIIIDSRVEINEIYYCVLLLPKWVLPGICCLWRVQEQCLSVKITPVF